MKSKIASFDLDSTLIEPKSGKTFPKNADDWKWLYDNVPDKLKELCDDGFTLIIISNQGGIKSGKQNGDEWIEKLNKIVDILDVEIMVLCSIDKNEYRKPLTKMRDDFLPKKLDMKSFYCGDAAGRKNDFSDTDYKFALNIDVSFCTPEKLFLNKKDIIPEIKYPINITKVYKNKKYNFVPDVKEVLLMVGYPGSGKSTFSKFVRDKYNYNIINQDTLKTKAKCKKEAIKLMEKNENVIIDATNPSKSVRKEWIDIAEEYCYVVRVIMIDENIEVSKHKNIYRSLISENKRVPDIGYNMYKSKYEEPELGEGIKEIVKIPGGHPDDKLYYTYLS